MCRWCALQGVLSCVIMVSATPSNTWYSYYAVVGQWFFAVFDEWEREVESMPWPAKEKQRACLSRETLQGLRITGTCMCMCICCLFDCMINWITIASYSAIFHQAGPTTAEDSRCGLFAQWGFFTGPIGKVFFQTEASWWQQREPNSRTSPSKCHDTCPAAGDLPRSKDNEHWARLFS